MHNDMFFLSAHHKKMMGSNNHGVLRTWLQDETFLVVLR